MIRDFPRCPSGSPEKQGRLPYYKGMKAHIGVEAESNLAHTLMTTVVNAHDNTKAQRLLHDQETDVFADSGYRGVEKREAAKDLQ